MLILSISTDNFTVLSVFLYWLTSQAGDQFSIGTLIILIILHGQLKEPLQQLFSIRTEMKKILFLFSSLIEFLDEPLQNSKGLQVRLMNKKKIKGSIRIENVSFKCPKRSPLLSNISFEVRGEAMSLLLGQLVQENQHLVIDSQDL